MDVKYTLSFVYGRAEQYLIFCLTFLKDSATIYAEKQCGFFRTMSSFRHAAYAVWLFLRQRGLKKRRLMKVWIRIL